MPRVELASLRSAILGLAEARYEPAVPALCALWCSCDVEAVRGMAGRALLDIGTEEALAVLLSTLDEHGECTTAFGIEAAFRTHGAFERLAPFFDRDRLQRVGGDVVALAVLQGFSPAETVVEDGASSPRWRPEASRDWLMSDARWLALCASLLHDERLGFAARDALRWADPAVVAKHIAAVSPPAATRSARGDLLARYERGEHRAVWAELHASGALEDDALEEALAVARATMRRAAAALEQLGARLNHVGWPTRQRALATEDADALRRMLAVSGARVPPSLRAFWDTIGCVDWSWRGDGETPPVGVEGVCLSALDPLVVGSPTDALWMLPAWEHGHADVPVPLRGPYLLPLAPGRLSKAAVDHDEPYGIALPFLGADPYFDDGGGLRFVEYVRHCIAWAGFPGLAELAERPDVRAFVQTMTVGLPPF